MTFDESNAAITEQMTGRTIEHVVRNGRELEFHMSCGHIVKLQADVNGDIHYIGTSVKIMIPAVDSMGIAGLAKTGGVAR